jgi:hypothetical protein
LPQSTLQETPRRKELRHSTRMRFIESFWIVIGLTAVLLVFIATQVSAVYDPLKSYHYSMTRDELRERLIQTIKSKPNLTFNLTDSTGTDKNDLNYYADILVKIGADEYEYNIKYKQENNFWDKDIKSEISLFGAFDKIHKTGGYKNDDTDVEKLVGIFENELIKELDKKNTSR